MHALRRTSAIICGMLIAGCADSVPSPQDATAPGSARDASAPGEPDASVDGHAGNLIDPDDADIALDARAPDAQTPGPAPDAGAPPRATADGLSVTTVGVGGDCIVRLGDGEHPGRARGLFDIAGGEDGHCEYPHFVHLKLASEPLAMSQGAAPGSVVQVHSAQVQLTTADGLPIVFDRSAPALPNPLLVTTNGSFSLAVSDAPSGGIVAVEAVPLAYAAQLDAFAGEAIMAEITVFATTTDDVDLDFPLLRYPIDLCKGCLTHCLTRDIHDQGRTVEDVLDPALCPDNSGSDDRLCIDPDC